MLLRRSPVNENTINRAATTLAAATSEPGTVIRTSLLLPLLYPLITIPTFAEVYSNLAIGSYLPLGIVKLLDKVTFFFSGCIYHIGSLPNYASNYKQLTSRRRKSIVTALHSSHLRHDITIGVLRLS